MTARSGQWSRCRATGTGTSAAACRNIVVIRSVPIERTVLTEIWMIIGELAATAAAITARRLRSSRMFTAGTAYPCSRASRVIVSVDEIMLSPPGERPA